MDDTIIERVARAIRSVHSDGAKLVVDLGDPPGDFGLPPFDLHGAARAAIDAMCEPTPEMLKCGAAAGAWSGGIWGMGYGDELGLSEDEYWAREVYLAAINAALQKQP